MKTLLFKGQLAKLFGEKHRLSVKTIQEGMLAIDSMKGGLRRYIMECQDQGIHFTVQKGSEVKEYAKNEEVYLDMNDMAQQEFDEDTYIITPLPAGSIKDAVKKIIIAIILIVISIKLGPEAGVEAAGFFEKVAVGLGYLGASLATQGLLELMMGDPDSNADGEKSSLFNGPVNTTKPGVPIPLAYGEIDAGGAVINFAFTKSTLKSAYGYRFASGSSSSSSTYSSADDSTGYDYGNSEAEAAATDYKGHEEY